jgi:uncharacterized protein (DUF2267 family)
MSTTGLPAFDSTLQKTHEWLNDICRELGTDSKQKAYLALRAALHTLRDRLTVDEAAHLGAQLPMLIRGFYYESWRPASSPIKWRTKTEFTDNIREYFRTTPNPEDIDVDPEHVARVVFGVLAKNVSEGEIEGIRGMLPGELADLIPTHAQVAPESSRSRGGPGAY